MLIFHLACVISWCFHFTGLLNLTGIVKASYSSNVCSAAAFTYAFTIVSGCIVPMFVQLLPSLSLSSIVSGCIVPMFVQLLLSLSLSSIVSGCMVPLFVQLLLSLSLSCIVSASNRPTMYSGTTSTFFNLLLTRILMFVRLQFRSYAIASTSNVNSVLIPCVCMRLQYLFNSCVCSKFFLLEVHCQYHTAVRLYFAVSHCLSLMFIHCCTTPAVFFPHVTLYVQLMC